MAPQSPAAVRTASASAGTPHAAFRFDRLDVWRGVAITWVFFYHLLGSLFKGADHLQFVDGARDYANPPHPALLTVYPFTFGWLGVVLFFVISGFCIHWSFLRWNSIPANRNASVGTFTAGFYWRRIWRIYPPYLAVLIFWAAYRGYDFTSLQDLKTIAVHGLMVHSLDRGHFYAIYGPFWSVAVEMQLYLAYPLVVLAYRRWGLASLVGLFVFSLIIRFLPWYEVIPNERLAFAFTHLPFFYWGQWLSGAIVAELVMRRVQPPQWSAIAFVFAVCGFLFLAEHYATGKFAQIAAFLLFSYLIWIAALDQRPLGMFEKVLATIGICSYSLYMIHNVGFPPLKALAAKFPEWSPWFEITLGGLLTLLTLTAISWILFRYLEKPSEKLGAMLWKKLLEKRGAVNTLAVPRPDASAVQARQ